MIETVSGGAPAHARRARGGFSPATAVVLMLVVTVVTALASAATGRGFGIAFNLVFAVVTTYAALRVHATGRWVPVVAGPLIYALALVIGGFFDTEETSHTVRRVLENTFVNLSFGGPWLTGTALLTLVIAVVRGRRARVASRHR